MSSYRDQSGLGSMRVQPEHAAADVRRGRVLDGRWSYRVTSFAEGTFHALLRSDMVVGSIKMLQVKLILRIETRERGIADDPRVGWHFAPRPSGGFGVIVQTKKDAPMEDYESTREVIARLMELAKIAQGAIDMNMDTHTGRMYYKGRKYNLPAR